MNQYLIISSRDPFESRTVERLHSLLQDLSSRENEPSQRNEITLFLVENGVLGARAAARGSGLDDLVGRNINVLADEFSLRERGIDRDELLASVTATPIDAVIDAMESGVHPIFY